ncbi:SIAE [Symbiodinium sp. KB8]|nr:SIAE [Symbiodinium sp. KB8]
MVTVILQVRMKSAMRVTLPALLATIACRSASATGNVSFAEVFGDYMVLQQHPAKAALFGSASGVAKVSLKVAQHGSGYNVEAEVKDGRWKALLTPTFKGGDWTITATAGDATAVLKHVAFGDVWYCSGQSNMALPLKYTLSRNQSVETIKANKFDIRIHGMSGNMNPTQPWMKAADAISQPAACGEGDCLFFRYSSTCWYFAESLVEKLGKEASPIGLIHTAWGGSMIEAWLDNKTISTCKNATLTAGNQKYHDERVMPYVGMTLKGWIWYQGENDMHGTHGNSELGYGYGCLMPALVRSWRALWSASDGTTQPDAPFGFVTLAASGSEGGNSMGAMRWAQTANYGVAPNPAMPNTFMAQAFDLDDPFSNITCYRAGCCGEDPKPACWSCLGPNGYCASLSAANYYMGPIHPRDKKPVGERLARAGAVVAYGQPGIFTGPTLSGCSVAGNKITVHFNNSLLYSEKVVVQDYQKIKSSRLEVLTNRSLFCLQTSGRKTEQCIDDGAGHATGQGPYDDTQTTWVAVDVTSAGPSSITVDLTKSGGKAFAIRYAWQGDCCDQRDPTGEPCPIASCPLMAEPSGLPANPFLARIEDGHCKCVAPQKCDENYYGAYGYAQILDAVAKLKGPGNRKLVLQSKIDEAKAGLRSLLGEMQELQADIKDAQQQVERVSGEYQERVFQEPAGMSEAMDVEEVLGKLGLELNEDQKENGRS